MKVSKPLPTVMEVDIHGLMTLPEFTDLITICFPMQALKWRKWW